MILFENSIATLSYNPATDILEVAYPDLQVHLLPEIKHTINSIVDVVRNYDVKNLLLDSRRTQIDVSDEQSREIAVYLATGLAQTRVQKVARVQSSSTSVEKTAQGNIEHITNTSSLPFQLQNFTNITEAILWLKASF